MDNKIVNKNGAAETSVNKAANEEQNNNYVELRSITKKYNDFIASDNVSFSVNKGSLTSLLGPSGSGKTTILRMIAGLNNPDSGEIFINGRQINDLAPSKRNIGFVFQNYALFRHMTVRENIGFGLKVRKKSKSEIKDRVDELLEVVSLTNEADKYPYQLSGGQRQRTAFARAIAVHPDVLLLDEPFAAIDAKVRRELRTWLKEMIEKLHITSIFVTHDQEEAFEVSDNIVLINAGHVEQEGAPEDFIESPASDFVKHFIYIRK